MSQPIHIRMGGFGPPGTTCSRGMKILGDLVSAEFGKQVEVHFIWNVMDLGYKAGDLIWMAEHGILSLAYQSTSYLTDRVPEMEFADLPFLFDGLPQARAAMDGGFGEWMTRSIERRIPGYKVVGYFENGYRHMSNRVKPIRTIDDIRGMSFRMMPSKTHVRSFELMGAAPHALDLKPGLEAIVSGKVDAQENPLANTVDYGAHKVHKYHTLTGHCYLSRGIYVNRAQFESWPKALQEGMLRAAKEAVRQQRDLAVEEENVARKAIEAAGGEVLELDPNERPKFVRAVQPLHDDYRREFGDEVFRLIPGR